MTAWRTRPSFRLQPVARLLAALFLIVFVGCAAEPKAVPGEPPRPLRPDTLEHNGWDRDCDLLHVDLNLTIDHAEERVEGSCTHLIRGVRASVEQIELHAVGLEIERVQDAEGRELEFEEQEPLLIISLAEPLTLGQEQSLTVHYAAQPEFGLYFRTSSKDFEGSAPQVWSQGQTEDHRHWIPLWDYPNDRASFSCALRVSDDLVALANGTAGEVEQHDDGSRTYHWELTQSIPTYLIAIAVGRWEKYADDWRGIPVEYWVGPGTGEEKARRAFGETPAMLDYFVELLGTDYPYERYAQVAVDDFVAGGMENATLTIQNDYVICSAAEDVELDGETRLLVAHELAHQWFGDLVTCFGWSHLWLNEAWASYLEVLWEGQVKGQDALALRMERYRRSYLRRSTRTRRPLAEDWRTQLTDARCSHEYVKGPWVLYMLEREVGSDDFWRAVQLYLERHADSLVTTDDFARAIFDATGRNVEGFLEQWVEAGGHPEYEVRLQTRADEAGDTLVIDVQQVQRTSELVPLFDIDVSVQLWDERGGVREQLRVRNASESFELPLVGELRDFQFDVDCRVLCDLDLQKTTEMWLHQGRSSSAAQRWRALAAIEAARDGGDLRALQLLRQLSAEDPEPFLRRRVNRGFTRAQHVPFLLKRLNAERDPLARVELLEILSRRPLTTDTLTSIRASFSEHSSDRVDHALEALEANRKQPEDING